MFLQSNMSLASGVPRVFERGSIQPQSNVFMENFFQVGAKEKKGLYLESVSDFSSFVGKLWRSLKEKTSITRNLSLICLISDLQKGAWNNVPPKYATVSSTNQFRKE